MGAEILGHKRPEADAGRVAVAPPAPVRRRQVQPGLGLVICLGDLHPVIRALRFEWPVFRVPCSVWPGGTPVRLTPALRDFP
jgi:hypothetical protein